MPTLHASVTCRQPAEFAACPFAALLRAQAAAAATSTPPTLCPCPQRAARQAVLQQPLHGPHGHGARRPPGLPAGGLAPGTLLHGGHRHGWVPAHVPWPCAPSPLCQHERHCVRRLRVLRAAAEQRVPFPLHLGRVHADFMSCALKLWRSTPGGSWREKALAMGVRLPTAIAAQVGCKQARLAAAGRPGAGSQACARPVLTMPCPAGARAGGGARGCSRRTYHAGQRSVQLPARGRRSCRAGEAGGSAAGERRASLCRAVKRQLSQLCWRNAAATQPLFCTWPAALHVVPCHAYKLLAASVDCNSVGAHHCQIPLTTDRHC
jgi:hypothetical protein